MTGRRRIAGAAGLLLLVLALPLVWSALGSGEDRVVSRPAAAPAEAAGRTIAVGRAELTVPAGWDVVELAAGEPAACDVAGDYFARPRLYVAPEEPAGVATPCRSDYTVPSTAGGLAVPLEGSRFAYLDGGEPIEVSGVSGTLFLDGTTAHYPQPDGTDRVEEVEFRIYTFPAVDLALRLRATPDPEAADKIVESMEVVGPLRPTESAVPSPPPAEAGALPDTLAAVLSDEFAVVRLDPSTGERLSMVADEREMGEGAGGVALTPDGLSVYFSRAVTGCSGEIVRVPVDGGPAEVVASGGRPGLSPDGKRLAYALDTGCGGEGAVLVVRDLATGAEQRSVLVPDAGERIGLASIAWSPDSRSLAVVVARYAGGMPRERSEVRVVDVARDQRLADSRVLPTTGATALDWRGALGTLVVATPDALVEVDPASGEVLRELLPVDRRVSSLATDPSGRHLLYVLSQDKQPGVHPQLDALYRWSGGDPVFLRDDVHSADW